MVEASVPEKHTFGHLLRASAFEFMGTAAVVYSFNFTGASYLGRSVTYFLWWILALSTSGAHFNPATSLAVLIAEGKYIRQIGRLILYWIF